MKQLPRFRDISLNWKIFLVSATIILCALLVTGVFIYNNLTQTYTDTLNRTVSLAVQKQSDTMANYFWRTEALVKALENEIPNFFPELETQSDVTDFYRTYLNMQNRYQTFCEIMFEGNSAYDCYLFLHGDLPLTAIFGAPDNVPNSDPVTQTPAYRLYSDANLTNRAWYQNTLASGGDVYWFSLPGDTDHLLAACEIRSMYFQSAELVEHELGVLVVSFDLSRITNGLENDVFGDNLRFFIADAEDKLIYAENSSAWDDSVFDQLESQSADSGGGFTVVMNGTGYRLWEEELPGGMRLFYYFPERMFDRQIRESIQLFANVLLIIVASEILLIGFFASFVTWPIKKLTIYMQAVSKPTPIRHNYHGKDEICVLYQTYNEMAENQSRMIQEIYDYAEEQKSMKYQLLQAQINPHFIYNTLDSVSCAALMNGEGRLSEVLSDLASLIRYNVYQPDQLVTLSEERKMLEKYIEIQQFRCDDHLRVTYDISPEVTGASVPKTLLQPIVENGISYGSANADGYRYLTIRARRLPPENDASGEQMTIEICNECAGEKNTWSVDVEQLNAYLDGQVDLKRKSSGLGILNVQQRIRLIYGERYGIHYERMGDQTAAVIRLPLLPESPENIRTGL